MQSAAVKKQYQQQMWAAGDCARISTGLAIVGEMLCESTDLRAGQTVLDVATGSGNTALAAARRWCEVVGVDFAPSQLERARERAACEDLPIMFGQGDAEHLPFDNASFDAVLSTFGVMFALEQKKAANELLRVCRPGGKVGLANWTPEGFMAEVFRKIGEYVEPPSGMPASIVWGTEHGLRQIFGLGIASMQIWRRRVDLRYRSARHWLDHMRGQPGPLLQAFYELDAQEGAELAADLVALVGRYNRSGDSTMVVPVDYLEVVALRR
jgi:SAM-dependent methyltransferase